MNKTKKWSLATVLCGLLVTTLLTACGGGGGSVWKEPNSENKREKPNQELPTIEQRLTFKADKPIYFNCDAFGFYLLYVNGDLKHEHFKEDVKVQGDTEASYVFEVKASDEKPELSELRLTFSFVPVDVYEKDPEFDNNPNPLKPIPTVVTYTWQERINGKITREESHTVKLYDPDNQALYKSKEYKSKIN
ncbi:hypothetical protein [Porphyromonas uenonis]|nr:hypothetical protein [Porphyromonas uenonis]